MINEDGTNEDKKFQNSITVDVECMRMTYALMNEELPIVKYFMNYQSQLDKKEDKSVIEDSSCFYCKKYICLCDLYLIGANKLSPSSSPKQGKGKNSSVNGDSNLIYYYNTIHGITSTDSMDKFEKKRNTARLERAKMNRAEIPEVGTWSDKIEIIQVENDFTEAVDWEHLVEHFEEIKPKDRKKESNLSEDFMQVQLSVVVPSLRTIKTIKIYKVKKVIIPVISTALEPTYIYGPQILPSMEYLSKISRTHLEELGFAVYIHGNNLQAIQAYTGIPMKCVIFLHALLYYKRGDYIHITDELASTVVERCWCQEDKEKFDTAYKKYGKDFNGYSTVSFVDAKCLWDFHIYLHWKVMIIMREWSFFEKTVFLTCYKIFKKDKVMYKIVASDGKAKDIEKLPCAKLLEMYKIGKTTSQIEDFMTFFIKNLSPAELKNEYSIYGMLDIPVDSLRMEYVTSDKPMRGRKTKTN